MGDVHGCADHLKKLLSVVGRTKDDHVVLLGDLVDRGPDSAGVVDIAIELEREQGAPSAIMGNHEEKHLQYASSRKEPTNYNHIVTKKQLRAHHYDFISRLPNYLKLPEHNIVCVHAGMWPDRDVERQSRYHLLHAQMLNPDSGTEKSYWPSRVPPNSSGWQFWTKLWKGPARVVFGHSVLTEPLVTDLVVGLDGGGCFGQELRALVIEFDGAEWIAKVDCSDLRHGAARIEKHCIEGNVYCYG